jgi:hypothetical protein
LAWPCFVLPHPSPILLCRSVPGGPGSRQLHVFLSGTIFIYRNGTGGKWQHIYI